MSKKFADTRNTPGCLAGVTGVNAGDVLATINPALNFERFCIHAIANTLDVQATNDGTNWVTVAVQDLAATASTTYVTTLTAGKLGMLVGRFVGVRIRQSGASAASGNISAG